MKKLQKHEYQWLASRAQRTIMELIKSGGLAPPSKFKCRDCGGRAYCYDHRDYNKPLIVQPVCRSCNHKRSTALPGYIGDENAQQKSWNKHDGVFNEIDYYQEYHLAVDVDLDYIAPDTESFIDETIQIGMNELYAVLTAKRQCLPQTKELNSSPI